MIPKAKKGREEEGFLQLVRSTARLLKWKVWHVRYSKGSDKGIPDLMMIRGKRLVFAELKRPIGGKYSPEQNECLQALAATGTEVYRWRPQDWDEISRVLNGEVIE